MVRLTNLTKLKNYLNKIQTNIIKIIHIIWKDRSLHFFVINLNGVNNKAKIQHNLTKQDQIHHEKKKQIKQIEKKWGPKYYLN